MTKTTRHLFWLLFSLPLLSWTAEARAHGSKITYQQARAIQITATYDNGKPMAEAQITVYAPSDPSTPWITGITDQQGNFTFIPDGSGAGNWDVKVRQAGHGAILSIPMGENGENIAVNPTPLSPPTFSTTPLQTALMAATGVWGFVGTALFFSRRKLQ